MRREQGRLREEHGLTGGIPRGTVESYAREAGFHRAAFVDPSRLPLLSLRAQKILRPEVREQDHLKGMEWDWLLESDRWSGSHSILVCCLSCHRDDSVDAALSGDPHGLIAPFARAHYYRTAVRLLRTVCLRLERELGIPRSSIRLFSNSRIPEKPLLAASGIGAYGKNGLLLVPGLGSHFVIAGVLLPVVVAPEKTDAATTAPFNGDPCASCRRCAAACPAGALSEPYVVDQTRCLQSLAGSTRPFPDFAGEAWGMRLYGCQDCQDACPHNAALRIPAPVAEGEIGAGISLRRFLGMSPVARASFLKGTALGVSWLPVEALLRNALVAAGNSGEPSLAAVIESYCSDESRLLRETARWAAARLARAATATCGCRS